MRLGIFGGTFDPIHRGHLAMAKAVYDAFHLDELCFIPVGQTPRQDKHIRASAEDRFAMTELAIQGNSGFSVSRMEIDRAGYSYTAETVQCIHHNNEHAQLYLILGADAFDQMVEWKDVQVILAVCQIVVLPRPGYDRDRFSSSYNQLAALNGAAEIQFFDGPMMETASRDIRKKIRKGQDISDAVPAAVQDYIETHRLYYEE